MTTVWHIPPVREHSEAALRSTLRYRVHLEGQDRRKLLHRERKIISYAIDLGDQAACTRRDAYVCHLGDRPGAFPDDSRVERTLEVTTVRESLWASYVLKKYPPCARNCLRTASSTGASTTTDCSEAHIVPLSKHSSTKMYRATFSTSAVRSTNTGTLPGLTSKAGLPEEHAAYTSPMPP